MVKQVDILMADPDDLDRNLPGLTDLLHAVVHAGGSVGFVLPFAPADAERFWRQQFADIRAGQSDMFLARAGDDLAGTVQLRHGILPNQAHRSDVSKLLVSPEYRRRGLGIRLMTALEARARDLNKRLLTLDTRTGDVAEPLYLGLGYDRAGSIPIYARAPDGSDRFDATTYMYKVL